MIVVSDTSPIRGLIAINKIILLHQLFDKVVLPKAVELELRKILILNGKVNSFMAGEWVEIMKIGSSQEYHRLRKTPDAGESEAIVLAHELGADMLLMDESKGRRLAQEMNIKVLGLIGVLLKAKKTGLISAVKPDMDKLRNEHGFWVQNDLYLNILRAAGELL